MLRVPAQHRISRRLPPQLIGGGWRQPTPPLRRTRVVASSDRQVPAAASSNSQSDDEQQAKPGLFVNILKPLRDFGIGRTSMVQGSVGLFVFSGIGAYAVDSHC